MAGWTNKGKYRTLGFATQGETVPTYYYVILWTSATAPTADTNTNSELTQIATGNGYATGGYQLNPGGTDFDTWTEDDGNDRGLVQVKDVAWNASGGPIPASGNGARYTGITDANATESAREVYWYFDLTSDRQVSDGQTLTLQDLEIRINES